MRKKAGLIFIIIGLTVVMVWVTRKTGNPEETRIISDLNFGWKFHPGDGDSLWTDDCDDENWRKVDLPHDWSIEGELSKEYRSNTAGIAHPGGIAWYRKSFDIPFIYKNKNVFVDFDGIYRNSMVWINGHCLGIRPDGCVSFRYNLTPYLHFGDRINTLAVRVDNSILPDSGQYSGSGIYRNVRLVMTGKIYIDHWGVVITCKEINPRSARIEISVKIRNSLPTEKPVSLSTAIINENGKQISSGRMDEILLGPGRVSEEKMNVPVRDPVLWSMEHPYLYRAIFKLTAGDETIDVMETKFGIRSFDINDKKGWVINGRPSAIKGVSFHQDLGCLGSAINARAMERNLVVLKEMGCNAIWTNYFPPAPELLDLCDRLGIIVIEDIHFDRGQGENCREYPIDREEEIRRDISDIILRDRNHPSVFIWNIIHELGRRWDSMSIDVVKEQIKIIDSLGGSRPVRIIAGNPESCDLEVSSDEAGLSGLNLSRDRFINFRETFPRNRSGASLVNSGTATRDDHDGIVDPAGFPGDAFYFYQSEWTSQPVLYLFPHWNGLPGEIVDAKVYTNAPNVELFLNGRSLGTRDRKAGDPLLVWRIPFEKGTLKAVAAFPGNTIVEREIRTAGQPAQLHMKADRNIIKADGYDLSFVTVAILDSAGNPVPDASNFIQFSLTGNGKIAGVDNGDPGSQEPYKANYRRAYNGQCLVVVQSEKKPGQMKLQAVSRGLKDSSLEIIAR